MKILTGKQQTEAERRFIQVLNIARESTCQKSKCGAVIFDSRGMLVGKGYNSPPGNLESQRRCNCDKGSLDIKVTDRTCCVHAEQRAIIDALSYDPESIEDSKLYFARLDSNGNLKRSGEPYCTICSKMALDVGVGEFILWRPEGICVYSTEEYNQLSFAYKSQHEMVRT
jgi:deoxycytidylate deaminase